MGADSDTNGGDDEADDSKLGFPGDKGLDAKKAKKRKERDREPLRSSIACQRCRTSKIKCNNNGDLSQPCPACLKSGRECVFPDGSLPSKRSHDPGPRSEAIAMERKRFKPAEQETARWDDPAAVRARTDEVLAAPYLTETVWGQMFDIYRVHYAAELPFLHLASLKSMIRRGKSERPHEVNLVLLGVLALCSRFHPGLTTFLPGPRLEPADKRQKAPPVGDDTTHSSFFFFETLTKALGELRESMVHTSVERVQAYLMLGLYEWTQPDPREGGLSAWMLVGNAIRMAQAMGLGFGDRPWRPWPEPQTGTDHESETLVREIRRRTMYSCFIMDRLLGCGHNRFSVIRSQDLQIQLPCTDVMFDLRGEAYTGFLHSHPDDGPVQKSDVSVQACFLRLLDLWADISSFSLAGGRRAERYEPWSPQSNFYALRVKLDEFYQGLPAILRWSTTNYDSHENHGAATPFVSMHVLGSLCRIVLHRESLPFLPLRCSRPSGPLDKSSFTLAQEPVQFWDDNAAEVFHAAFVIVSVVDTCRDKLPVSALVLYAAWMAAFIGVYAAHFPHMDPNGYLTPSSPDSGKKPAGGAEVLGTHYLAVLIDAMARIAPRMRMASRYIDMTREFSQFFAELRREYDSKARGLTHQPKRGSKVESPERDRASDGMHSVVGEQPRSPLGMAKDLVYAARTALQRTHSEGAPEDASSAEGGGPSRPVQSSISRRYDLSDLEAYLDQHASKGFAEGPWSVNGLSNPGVYYEESVLDIFHDIS